MFAPGIAYLLALIQILLEALPLRSGAHDASFPAAFGGGEVFFSNLGLLLVKALVHALPNLLLVQLSNLKRPLILHVPVV